jgi:recombination protein RecT
LQKCSEGSIRTAICNVALTGLSLNPVLKYAYLVPRGAKAVLDISYVGMIKILTDTGSVNSIYADLVYSNDLFQYEQGTSKVLRHTPELIRERGDLIGAYSIATLNNGEQHFIFMRKEELDKVKESSVYSKKGSIWDKWEGEMYKKTVLKRHFKTLPKSEKAELAAAAIDVDHASAGFEKTQVESVDDLFDEAEIIPDAQQD